MDSNVPMQKKRGRPKGSKNKPKDGEGQFKEPLAVGGDKAKSSKRLMHQECIYTDLSKTTLGSNESYNIWGVIIDATYPYLKNDKYIC